jgi:hypothetical protein
MSKGWRRFSASKSPHGRVVAITPFCPVPYLISATCINSINLYYYSLKLQTASNLPKSLAIHGNVCFLVFQKPVDHSAELICKLIEEPMTRIRENVELGFRVDQFPP